MFEREHHHRIARVLEALDAQRLLDANCLFGGGTAIALRQGEFRESVDIDFITSRLDGYRDLRQALTTVHGLSPITRAGHALALAREVRADQYGIRALVSIDEVLIKFEIVLEARVQLEAPGPDDAICGIATLTALDLATTKLLANSDRWADDSVLSRDLIDLAMLAPGRKLLRQAIAKARTAYGDSVQADLSAAIERLRERPQRLDVCMQALQITHVPKAVLWSRIKALVP